MIELNMDFIDFQSNIKRLNDLVYKLEASGWGKFIDCSGILWYKNIQKETAKEELEQMRIQELEPIEWSELITV